jgi:DNA replication regulator SLD3
MFVKSQPSELPRTTEEMDLGAIPPSSLPRIPQSSKQSQEKKLIKNPFFSSVQATPTRRPATSQPTSGLLGPPIDYGEFPPSSPLHVRRSSASLFPIVPESTLKAPSGFEMPSGVQETPIKKRPDPQLKHSHPGIPASGSDKENTRVRKEVVTNIQLVPGISQRQEDSIYKSLGWDDADDMDELA